MPDSPTCSGDAPCVRSLVAYQQRKSDIQNQLHDYLRRKRDHSRSGCQDGQNHSPEFVHELLSNPEKMHFYALVELLRLDFREDLLQSTQKEGSEKEAWTKDENWMEDASQFESDLNSLLTTIGSLHYKPRPPSWICTLDDALRLLAAWLIFCSTAVLFPLPFLLLKALSKLLLSTRLVRNFDMYSPIALVFTRTICKLILVISALKVEVTDERSAKGLALMNTHRSVTCFNHTSTIDAFVLPAVATHFGFVLAKKELFGLPFFSWLVAVFGGIPIDRRNLDSAVQSLQLAASCVRPGQTVSIAPEGTRSNTGLLLPFKKGPFHLWEAMNKKESPICARDVECIVQPIVITGAFELFPPSSLFSVPGVAEVHFLEPIHPSELRPLLNADASLSERDAMSRLLRRRILESSVCPAISILCMPSSEPSEGLQFPSTSKVLTLPERAWSITLMLASISGNFMLFFWFYRILSSDKPYGFAFSNRQIATWGGVVTVGVTAAIFTYYTLKLKRSNGNSLQSEQATVKMKSN